MYIAKLPNVSENLTGARCVLEWQGMHPPLGQKTYPAVLHCEFVKSLG